MTYISSEDNQQCTDTFSSNHIIRDTEINALHIATFIIWLLKFTLKILNLNLMVLSFNFRLIMLSASSSNLCHVLYYTRFLLSSVHCISLSLFNASSVFHCSGQQCWNWHPPATFIKVNDSSWTSTTFCRVCLIVATPLSKTRRTHKGAVNQVKIVRP